MSHDSKKSLTEKMVDIPEPEDGELYLEAIVLIKTMSPNGRIVYKEYKSNSLTHVEALGMATTYCDTVRQLLTRSTREM